MVAPAVAAAMWSGGIQGLTSIVGGSKERHANAKAQAKALNDNMFLLNEQRLYDLPAAARKRLEDAGFNPGVFYAGIGSSSPGIAAPSMAPATMGNGIARAGAAIGNSIADGVLAQEQINIQKAELEVEKQRVEQLATDTKLKVYKAGVFDHAQKARTIRGKPASSRDAALVTGEGSTDSLRTARLNGAGNPTEYNDVVAPAFKALGMPWYGSGAFSSGQTFEDAVGDGPLSWANGLAVVGDAVGYTLGNETDKLLTEHVWKRHKRETKYRKKSDEERKKLPNPDKNPNLPWVQLY